jgi:DNA-binding NtrC family response regulator
LFLDEVGDMPMALQTRLLRVLQERRVTPVGQTEPIPVDVRILAATYRNLPLWVRLGRFREDLFYRLSAFRLDVPPLRQRQGDILPLAEHFLDLQATIYEEPRRGLSEAARHWLVAQQWRGNVRELANAIEYALVASDQDQLMPEDFPEPSLTGQHQLDTPSGSEVLSDGITPGERVMTMREAEWQAVAAALRASGGDKTRAAQLLAVSRSRIYSILARRDQGPRSSSNRSAS